MRRLGQAIGAMCGGPSMHPGGYKIWCDWDKLPEGEVRFDVWVGAHHQQREAAVIAAVGPLLNVQHNT